MFLDNQILETIFTAEATTATAAEFEPEPERSLPTDKKGAEKCAQGEACEIGEPPLLLRPLRPREERKEQIK